MKKILAILLALMMLLLATACGAEKTPAPVNPVAPPVSDVDPSAPTDPAPAPGDDSPIPVDPPTNPDPVDPNTPVAPEPIAPTPAPTDPYLVIVALPDSVAVETMVNYQVLWCGLSEDTDPNIDLQITSSDGSVMGVGGWQLVNFMPGDNGYVAYYHTQAIAYGAGTTVITATIANKNVSATQTVVVY